MNGCNAMRSRRQDNRAWFVPWLFWLALIASALCLLSTPADAVVARALDGAVGEYRIVHMPPDPVTILLARASDLGSGRRALDAVSGRWKIATLAGERSRVVRWMRERKVPWLTLDMSDPVYPQLTLSAERMQGGTDAMRALVRNLGRLMPYARHVEVRLQEEGTLLAGIIRQLEAAGLPFVRRDRPGRVLFILTEAAARHPVWQALRQSWQDSPYVHWVLLGDTENDWLPV